MYALIALLALAQDTAPAAVYHVNSLPDGLPGIVVEATLPAGQMPSELKIVHEKTSKEKRLTIVSDKTITGGTTRYTAMMADREWGVACYPNDGVRVMAKLGDSWHEVGETRVRYNRQR